MQRSGLIGLAVASLLASGCCKGESDAPRADVDSPVSAATAARPRQPIALIECKASTEGNVGGFVPTTAQVIAAAETLPTTCLPASRIADALSACAAQVGPVCVAGVEAPGYTACQATVKTLQAAGKKFILVEVFIGEGSNFHGRVFVLEMNGDAATMYYRGFIGDEKCEQSDGASSRMKADWATLGPEARQFICPE